MDKRELAKQHLAVTRRYFLETGAAGLAALSCAPLLAGDAASDDVVAKAIEQLQSKYLTPVDDFRLVERGNPMPSKLPPEKLREVGLIQETWQLEVMADPESDSVVERPLTKEQGNALTWKQLMELAETRAVRYMKVMSCNNVSQPLGMGLWEGVPLRDVVWLARPARNVRQVYYHGYHNDDPGQIFQCWLSINRVLEDPPGELPVLLCYKLNGKFLTAKEGGPVRMLVPETYGFKSVKWLQQVVLTNKYQALDTYALKNNDPQSWLKTAARFAIVPEEASAYAPIGLTGLAQVGISGLSKVQYWLKPKDSAWPEDDPYFTKADWQDAQLLPAPDSWKGQLPQDELQGGGLPEIPGQFDSATGKPLQWPLRNSIVHWAAVAAGVAAGQYELRCRTIDEKGHAQPMPRPFAKSGNNAIQSVNLLVKA